MQVTHCSGQWWQIYSWVVGPSIIWKRLFIFFFLSSKHETLENYIKRVTNYSYLFSNKWSLEIRVWFHQTKSNETDETPLYSIMMHTFIDSYLYLYILYMYNKRYYFKFRSCQRTHLVGLPWACFQSCGTPITSTWFLRRNVEFLKGPLLRTYGIKGVGYFEIRRTPCISSVISGAIMRRVWGL